MASLIIRKPGSPTPQSNPQSEPIKFSIVDDDTHDCFAMSRELEKSGELACAGLHRTAEVALTQIPRVRPSVVLMDIWLPGMSGLQCAPLLKTMLPEAMNKQLRVYWAACAQPAGPAQLTSLCRRT